jgi:tRNA U55 pseudouridine synthase TruB
MDYGSGAHLIRLRRTRSGDFSIENAAPLNEGDQFYPRDFFLSRLIPMRNLLCNIPAIVISDGDKKKLLHGMDLNLLTADWESQEFRLLDTFGELIAIAERIQSFLPPVPQPAQWVRIHPRVTFA